MILCSTSADPLLQKLSNYTEDNIKDHEKNAKYLFYVMQGDCTDKEIFAMIIPGKNYGDEMFLSPKGRKDFKKASQYVKDFLFSRNKTNIKIISSPKIRALQSSVLL